MKNWIRIDRNGMGFEWSVKDLEGNWIERMWERNGLSRCETDGNGMEWI